MTTPWRVIQEHLINDGVMTEQGVTRTPKPRHCRDCGAAVIAAITDLGLEVAVHPTPTTPGGELGALMAGSATYALLDHGEMVHRDQYRIAKRNADQECTYIQHVCGMPQPERNTHFIKEKHEIDSDNAAPPF